MKLSIKEIEKKLIDGNNEFIKNNIVEKDFIKQRKRLIKKQDPYVIILSCSDSRVPVEIIFNTDLGSVFNIRIPGNIVDEVILESIEYAIKNFQCQMVLVLGHENCGAVKMALDKEEDNKITKQIDQVINKSKNLD